MRGLLAIIFGFSIVVVSCKEPEVKSQVVAKVGEQELLEDDIRDLVSPETTLEDSTELVDKFIQSWIREQVIYNYASGNLPAEDLDFESEIESYRKSLLTFAFENHIVNQHLDTLVSPTETESYYNDNQDNFLLKDYILRVKFCILDSAVVTTPEFENLFDSNEAEDLVEFEKFCVDNGAVYFIDEEKWLYLSDLLNEVPLQVYNIERFLKKSKSLNFSAEGKKYFLKVVDYKLKDSVSPLSLQMEKIRTIILNKRKLDLLSKMRNDLYQEAVKKNQIHIYTE